MILALWLLIARPSSSVPPPQFVFITTSRGETSVPVTTERGTAAVAAPYLEAPLGLTAVVEAERATVELAGTAFVFLIGAPFLRVAGAVYSLVGESYIARDTLFLPLHWLAEYVPRVLASRYRWDPGAARLEEILPPPLAPPDPRTGLRQRHTIVIDPGHGGVDPGNPGLHFPGRLVEKDITLAIGRLLRAELVRRGLQAALTRTTDTLIDLADRGARCRDACDLFVSVHVNAMPASSRRGRTSGVETYFLSDAKTEHQRRVAQMENDAIRFETDAPGDGGGDLGFILRDLQLNEYLRQSARLAELVQGRVAGMHPGGDRGVQQAAFVVLTTARRPAILIETGFATNRTDGAFLASSLGQHRIASAIADGIVGYLLELERKLAGAGPAR